MSLFGPSEITGIDIGAGGIKAVRIRQGKQPELLAAALIEFSPEAVAGESVGTDLRYLLSEKKVGNRNVITKMPGKDLTIRSLTLPRMPLVELREAVRWEAKRHISYPVDTALVEYLITGEKKEGTVDKYDLVMVAAEASKVKEHLLPFDEAGIKVSVVDANPLALRNVLFPRGENSAVDTLVVDIGAGKMEIDIFKNGVLRFSRCLETGGADLTRLVADDMNVGMQDAEAFKRNIDLLTPPEKNTTAAAVVGRLDAFLMEIRRSVEYYRTTYREKAVDRVILTGGATLMRGLPEYFSQALGLPVARSDPFGALKCKDALGEEFGPLAPCFSAVVGLALRKM
jgi:type IV pilus assembly protein PilM